MTSARQRLVDLLAIGRVANLPTVVSNVLLGFALGTFMVTWIWSGKSFSPGTLLTAVTSGICLYLGGCFLNDWKDATWDRKHRRERAIPQGRMKRLSVGALAVCLLLAGLGLASFINLQCLITAAAIVLAIIVYTAIHKATKWAIVPMALCRALLYPLGFLAAYSQLPVVPDPAGLLDGYDSHDTYVTFLFGLIEINTTWDKVDLINGAITIAVVSLGLFAYVAAISLIARFESRGTLHRSYLIMGLGLVLVAVSAHALFWYPDYPPATGLCIVPLVLVAAFASIAVRKNVGKGVGLLLAGIPLLDLVSMGPLAVAIYEEMPREAILWGGAPIACFLLALVLQRIAPAT